MHIYKRKECTEVVIAHGEVNVTQSGRREVFSDLPLKLSLGGNRL